MTDALGVARSYGRPRVCNDNPFSEAINRTAKYSVDYPDRFNGYADARNFCRGFFVWYNTEHRHSGINYLAPATVHRGQHDEVIARRQETLDAAKTAHPERFVNGPPRAKPLADAVYINKPKSDTEIQVEAH